MPADTPYGNNVIVTWRDLQRKYIRDKQAIRSTWISLSPEKRKEVILAGVNGGEEGFLRHREDSRLGSVRYIIPELNLKDLIPGENALELLEKRATTPVLEMYSYDAHTMVTSMRVNGVNHATGRKKGAVMMFIEETQYGSCMELTAKSRGDEMENLIQMGKGCIVSENEGMVIVQRQLHIYSFLSMLVDDIMDTKRRLDNPVGSKKLPKKRRAAVKPKEEVHQTLQRLEVSGSSKKVSAKDLGAKRSPKDISDSLVQEQLLSAEDHVNFIHEEPLYFSHIANNYFFSSPGMVPNEKGIQESTFNSSAATKSVVELLRDAYQAASYWKYLSILTSELTKNGQHMAEKIRNSLTDELWATCTKELLRSRTVYRRFVQTESKYSKFFVRDDSDPKNPDQVNFKNTLETVAKKNQFTYWILQLATKTELTDDEVAKLLKSLEDFQEIVPKARELISESMGDALADISVIIAFMALLKQVIVVPEQTSQSSFEKRVAARTVKIEEIWSGIDLADYAFPVDNLKEPAAAHDCIRVINERLSGSGLGVELSGIFQEPIEKSVLEILGKLAESEVVGQKNNKDVPVVGRSPGTKPKEGHEISTPEIADKVKKYFPTNNTPCEPTQVESMTITAIPATVKTFRKLFRQDPSSARGSIPWSTFISAMKSIGFTVEPIGDSISRFRPSEDLGVGDKSINFHRPHPTDKLEGWALLRLASRLKGRYGWGADTFVTGKK